jgi:hypothetical protein
MEASVPASILSSTGADDNSLNAAEQRELNSRMEKKQMKEFMTVYFYFGTLSNPFHGT